MTSAPEPLSQYEIAERYGVSQPAVHELKKQALRKLREGLEREARKAGVSVKDWLLGEEN